VSEATTRATNRWVGTDAVAWAAAAVGLLAREPGILLLAGVGVAFAAHARVGTPPRPDLQVTRVVDDETPVPGQEVTVTLTVENRGERVLPDVRLVDGVPTDLRVQDGSPHLGTVLRAGESRTHAYAIRAERGTHEFDPVEIACRSLNGSHETELTSSAETTVTCQPTMDGADAPPLRDLVAGHGGQLPTDRGGTGIEFHGVREYRPGDRANRIDWARRARTGELTTLEFREERRATVVLCIDAREAAHVKGTADDGEIHAVERSVRAAADISSGLLDAGHRVGLAAVGADFAWLAPGSGLGHRRRARDVLSTHSALSPSPPRDRLPTRDVSMSSSSKLDPQTARQLRSLDVHLPVDAQVFVLSPLADDAAVTMAHRMQAAGNAVTVINPVARESPSVGARVAQLERKRRVRDLRRATARVIEWRADEPLAVAFERAREASR
jgi:uncharacterized repeat protein (TIGR01451 family)